jgi:hypothetical protein
VPALAPPNERKPQTANAKIADAMKHMRRSRLADIDGQIGNRKFCNLALHYPNIDLHRQRYAPRSANND